MALKFTTLAKPQTIWHEGLSISRHTVKDILPEQKKGLDKRKNFSLVLFHLMIWLLLWHCPSKPLEHAIWFWTLSTKTETGLHTRQYEGALMTVMLWEDKRDIYILNAPSEQKASWMNTITPSSQTLLDATCAEGMVTGMSNSQIYAINQHTFKWLKEQFFGLLDLTILNSWAQWCKAAQTMQESLRGLIL